MLDTRQPVKRQTEVDHKVGVLQGFFFLLVGNEKLLVLLGDVFGLQGKYSLLERDGTAWKSRKWFDIII